jgi:hypothetical protein
VGNRPQLNTASEAIGIWSVWRSLGRPVEQHHTSSRKNIKTRYETIKGIGMHRFL